MKNYHNEEVQFAKGDKVQHVDDEGNFHIAHVVAVDGDCLVLAFEDGDEGMELARTCFHFGK